MAVITTSGPLEASAGDPSLILDSFLKEPALSLDGAGSLFLEKDGQTAEKTL